MPSRANPDKASAFLDVLGIGSFRWLWTGQIFSQLAQNSLLFILGLRVYQATGSNTAVSVLFLVYGLPAVFVGMVAGSIVDKLNKRDVLLFCDFVRAILIAFLVFFSRNVPFIYMMMFTSAVVTQFYVPSEGPTIPTLVPKHRIVTANSLFSFTYFGSLAAGSILAGPLLRWFGPYWVFVLLAGFFLIAAWSVSHLPGVGGGQGTVWIRLKTMSVPYIAGRIVANVQEGISYVRGSRVLSDALVLLTGTQIIFALLGILGPGFADKVLGIDLHDASLLITGPVVLGIVLGALWVGMVGHRLGANRLITTGVASAGVILLGIALVVFLERVAGFSWFYKGRGIVGTSIVLFFLLGVANSFLDVPANSVLQQEARGSMRSRVYGMLAAAVGGVGVLPVVAGGILADVVGVGKVLALLGGIIIWYGVARARRADAHGV